MLFENESFETSVNIGVGVMHFEIELSENDSDITIII